MRVVKHPILPDDPAAELTIYYDGKPIPAKQGEPIAAALLASGIRVFRETAKHGNPRGIFCGIGRCTDCVMTVDGQPNVRTCVTPVREGMQVVTQKGLGRWSEEA
jgi:aerobic-type carbon monoxide dehydrogenase small subunit (CoxS/CutS family)